jgi:hypothetical protein
MDRAGIEAKGRGRQPFAFLSLKHLGHVLFYVRNVGQRSTKSAEDPFRCPPRARGEPPERRVSDESRKPVFLSPPCKGGKHQRVPSGIETCVSRVRSRVSADVSRTIAFSVICSRFLKMCTERLTGQPVLKTALIAFPVGNKKRLVSLTMDAWPVHQRAMIYKRVTISSIRPIWF